MYQSLCLISQFIVLLAIKDLNGKNSVFLKNEDNLIVKRPVQITGLLIELLQARLELAPRVNPDWILSPTRLPIPPLERIIFSFHASAESVNFYTSRKTLS